MKKLILLALLMVGMTVSCVKSKKQSKWKVEITSTQNINQVIIAAYDFEFQDANMTTTSIVKEFSSATASTTSATAWGDGVITIRIWKDGKDMKEISGNVVGSGLTLEY